jgi:large subunit ribosomal protein L6
MTQAQAAESGLMKSRIGKRPVVVPKAVSVNINGARVEVQGPKGKLAQTFDPSIVFTKEGEKVHVSSNAPGRNASRLQGLGRALLANMVKGAAEGYEQTLDLVGTGYRVEQKGKSLHFSLGLSHPVQVELPPGLTATIPGDSKGAVLILTSPDKAVLGQFSARIRSFRPPEPYGGKGVRYRGEQIRRKAGKAGKGKAK